jgi:hypothetical protein
MTEAKRPSVRIEQVSPALADKWLSAQVRNRDLREERVEHLCHVIERGEWELTNDAIAFDAEGQLLNGQHRLTAIVVMQETLPLVVLRNLPPKVQDVMDTGLQRKTADALRMRGEKNTFALAAGLRWEHRLRWLVEEAEDRGTDAVHHRQDRASTVQLLRIFDEDPDGFREFTSDSQQFGRNVGMRNGLGIAIRRRLYALSAEDYADFAEKLLTGAHMAKNDPILQLRNVLINQSSSRGRRGASSRMPDYREAAVIIKAWNLYREGDTRSNLVWHFGGAHREAFPVPR